MSDVNVTEYKLIILCRLYPWQLDLSVMNWREIRSSANDTRHKRRFATVIHSFTDYYRPSD